MSKNILFLCYWSLEDNLVTATVLPRLRVLQQFKCIGKIFLVTIEREPGLNIDLSPTEFNKVLHQPIFPKNCYYNALTKINDFVVIPKILNQLVKTQNIAIILAHGAPAGALAYKVCQKAKIPFYVSSFEPHAQYMAESGVWSRYGLKYRYQKKWEKDVIKTAKGVMPVAENYTEKLLAMGVSADKVFTVPCSVATETFRFCDKNRNRIRENLGFDNNMVGIYVGKYGGLYYNEEAFLIYQQCFLTIPHFRLIILSPQPQEEILQQLKRYKIDFLKVYVASVSHELVPAYLSASDFAFATYKPGPSKKYLSPVKVGEYWANGLPVLLTEGVGDDSDIIKKEGGGAVFNLQQEGSLSLALQQIQEIVKDPSHRLKIPDLAMKYRSPDKIKAAYQYFLGKEEGGQ